MATANARSSHPLAWTSLILGLIGLAGIVIVAVGTRVSALDQFFSSLGVPNWVSGFFLVLGGLGLLTGIFAVVAMIVGHRRGWIATIVGILLGLFNILLGLAAIALSNLKLNIGPF